MGRKFFWAGAALSICWWLVAGVANANQDSAGIISRVSPAPEHVDLDRTITNLLSIYHYKRSKPDDDQSQAILDAYLKALDFSRIFFLASDVRNFEKYRKRLDDYLLAGNLEPAYEVFNVYVQRLAERNERVKYLLQQPIDFSVEESVDLQREEAEWARSSAELDEIWRKRLKHELLLLMLAEKDTAAAKDTLLQRYQGRLGRTLQYKSQDVFQLYMNAVAASFDPHTAYFSPRATENFNIQMRLSLEGIGTVLRMEEEQITVVELVPGGPAALSGNLHPKDRIVGVGEGDEDNIVDIVGWRLDDVVDLIRGRRGTVVRLEVIPVDGLPGGAHKIVRLERDTIRLEQQAAKGEVRTVGTGKGEHKIGVVTIPTFYSDFAAAQRGEQDYRSTTRDVRRILQELGESQVDGILIDLRQNGGGSLQEAIELSGLFIPEGPVVQVRNASGNVEVETDPDPRQVYDGPLAVLVNRFSASASEIFAGAMQDYGRAAVIGNPTFGKGTVQTLVNLNRFVSNADAPPLGQLKLTIAKFYRVNGSSTQHRGVIPDIRLPSLYEEDDVGESSQEFALPWDEISPVRYSAGARSIGELVPTLQQRHQQRVRDDEAFQQLIGDIAESKEARDRTEVSLVESERRQERLEAEAKRRERVNQQRLAVGLTPLQEDQSESNDQEFDTPDPLLDESVQIVADMISLQGEAVVMTQ